jgi:CheY-like chemotaxis protein
MLKLNSKMTDPASPGVNPPIPPGKTILLADDDAFSVLLIQTFCMKHNISLLAAENGQIAFEMAIKHHIDLILTDINMPVISGLDFSRNLQATPEISYIPVIAVTANVLAEDLKRMSEAGFSEILIKPFREKDFIEKISLFLQ